MIHAVCVKCYPELDGPARCGTPFEEPVEGDDVLCAVCMDLDSSPCERCQPDLFAVYLAYQDKRR